MLIEELDESDCALLREENAALRVRRAEYQGSTVHRLAFWSCLPETTPESGDLIGYAIFKSDRFSDEGDPRDHIYEAVMRPIRNEPQNNFIHCRRNYTVRTEPGEYTVQGVLYSQQNDLTYVCAHAALRSALSSLVPAADVSYGRMNELAGIDHSAHRVGGADGGLSPDQMESIVTGVGYHCEKIVHEPKLGHSLPTEFQRDLYGFIESGYPALMGFELTDPIPSAAPPERHIISVVGHTFNEDTWVPEAQRAYFGDELSYFSSESWLSTYVVHDDNFGPYFCMPRHFLKKDNFRIILGLLPQRIEPGATDAEAAGFEYLRIIAEIVPRISQDWYDRFAVFTRLNLLVLRTFLTDRSSYLRHLETLRSWEGDRLERERIEELTDLLPECFWMIEASAQELFNASRRKFGEILLSCTTSVPEPLNFSLFLAARLPGLIFTQDSSSVIEPKPTVLRGHTRLFDMSSDSTEPFPEGSRVS